jgi:hypothetical protein
VSLLALRNLALLRDNLLTATSLPHSLNRGQRLIKSSRSAGDAPAMKREAEEDWARERW